MRLRLSGRVRLPDVAAALAGPVAVVLDRGAAGRIARSRAHVLASLAGPRPVYGLNTGFGRLAQVRVPPKLLGALQENLVRSHACGVGDPLPREISRLVLYLKIQGFAQGFSGVGRPLVDFLIALLNRDLVPVIPAQGSVGASGDLAPLAHLALPLLREGEIWIGARRVSARRALARAGLRPPPLGAKEGLSLLNGTQVTTAAALAAGLAAERLCRLADVSGAMTLEALKGTPAAFDPALVRLKRHRGAATVAAHLRRLLAGSQIRESHRDCPRVQDAYSLRCMPQVHGAVREALARARETLMAEANACSDNPAVLPDGRLAAGGNFHAMAAALAADQIAAAVAPLGTIVERRIERLVNPDLSGLPPFLVRESGLHSGFMIAQVTAAALASENKVLAHPASVDTIPTSAGQEDHVSMGTAAAVKALRAVANLRAILAIEFLCAAQGLEFAKPLAPGRGVARAYRWVRRRARPLARDRILHRDIARLARDLASPQALSALSA